MGFEAKKKIFKLKFADPEMEGLEVRIKSTSMGSILDLAQLDDINVKNMTKEDIQKIREVFQIVERCLLSWNLEEDGVPVPLTVDGLLSQDTEFVFAIVKAWVGAMTQVDIPLDQPLPNGVSSGEQLMIPMEPLLENQAS